MVQDHELDRMLQTSFLIEAESQIPLQSESSGNWDFMISQSVSGVRIFYCIQDVF